MPTVPSQIKCTELGCKNLRSKFNRFCLDHGGRNVQPVKQTKKRKEFNAAYGTLFWKKQRQLQLSTKPICQACECRGIITSAAQVDHLFPWSQIGEHAFRLNVFQSLCAPCHAEKSALEHHGIIRHWTEQGVIDYRIGDYPRVMVKAFYP